MERLKNSFENKRCVIMGNGPSLNKMDLDVFARESIWAANGCFLLFEKLNWRPKFYVARDLQVIENLKNEIRRLIAENPNMQFFFPKSAAAILGTKEAENIHYFNEVPPHGDANGRFSADCAKEVIEAKTVTMTSLQLAAYLGFNRIYLIGCDNAYPNYQAQDGQVVGRQKDLGHFSEDYLKFGQNWTTPDPGGMQQNYRAAKHALDDRKVEVYNATVGGSLEEFPRVNYEDIFALKRG
jgi:hypothetical protein